MDRSLLLKLYPRDWRARYADEFLAVLDEVSLTPRFVLDIAAGAVDARVDSIVKRFRPARRRRTPEWLLVVLIASILIAAPSVLRFPRWRIRLVPAFAG